MNEQPAKPKRRRFRFTLRTMFLVVFVMCLLLGWKANKAHQQREAVAWVREMGGEVYYEYQRGKILDEYQRSKGEFYNTLAEEPGPAWLRNLIGIEFFSEVTYVNLSSTPARDVTPLAKLTKLKDLKLKGTPVSDESLQQLQKVLPNCAIQSD